jgi:D-alanyl-D-alanine carboxypeptidase
MHLGPSIVKAIAACAACLAVFASAASPALPSPAAANSAAGLTDALSRELNAYLSKYGKAEHVSALSLSVSLKPGSPPIDIAAGTTRYGGGPKASPSDLYQIGSNTKSFTAVAVLRLEAQGRLSIDAPIGKYLPKYPAYAKLTLRQLLSMTGGLETYDDTSAWYRMFTTNPMRYTSSDELIRLIYPKIKWTPGTKWVYSNTGYLLAQEVVAALSPSHSFSAEIAKIIAQAGLKNTYYSDNFYPPQIARRVVAGYYENNDPGFEKFMGKNMTPYTVSWAQGAGSIVSTAEDLTVWSRAIYQGSALLPERQKRELMSLVSTKTAKPVDAAGAADPGAFGLGVAQRYDKQLGAFWFYQGETLGFRAAHLYFPDSGLVVSIFANSRPVERNSHIAELFSTLYKTIASHPVS